MRTRNALERLAVAGRPILADAEGLVDAAEQDRIFERIVASDRQAPAPQGRRRTALVLAGIAVAGAALAVGVVLGPGNPSVHPGGHHDVALTGPTIQLAGYHFRTPAGFKASSRSCGAASSSSGPDALSKSGPDNLGNGFAAAASADGGCVGASFLIASNPTAITATPAGQPVNVGSYQGYYDSQGGSGESTLYVALPKAGASGPVYLVLEAENLTEDQLIAVAQSGLPGSP